VTAVSIESDPAPAVEPPVAPGIQQDSPPRRASWEVGHLALAAVAIAILLLSVGPITDIDTYWHVLIGQEVLDSGRTGGLGNSWSLYVPGQDWITSQWGSEVVMSATHQLFGWSGIVWLRTLLVLTLLAALAVLLLKRASASTSAVVFALVLVPCLIVLQERPLLASLIFLAWLSGVGYDLLTKGRQPRWFVVLPLVALWANLHGMWVLAPATFALVAITIAVDRNPAKSGRLRGALILTVVSILGGCLTSIGIKGLLLPFVFRSATPQISEWQPVPLTSPQSFGLAAMFVTLVYLWARSPSRVPRSHIIYAIAWCAFGFTAYRNLLPAAIMMAPLAAASLSRTRLLHPRRPAPEQQKAIGVVTAITLIAGLAGLIAATARVDPLAAAKPLAIAERLAKQPGETRVFNGYNTAGVLAAFGGDGIRLAIDGRSDRFGGDYIERYVEAMSLGEGWQDLLRQVDPDAAVIDTSSALAYELTKNQGWTLVMTDGTYSLLTPPPNGPLREGSTSAPLSAS